MTDDELFRILEEIENLIPINGRKMPPKFRDYREELLAKKYITEEGDDYFISTLGRMTLAAFREMQDRQKESAH